jgi:hypothetical protein
MGAGIDTTSFERQPRRARRAVIAAAAFALAIAIPTTAFAGKGGGGATTTASWIALASVDGAKTAAAQPSLGASVKFGSGYPSTTRNPWVSLTCWQGDALVSAAGGVPTAEFALGGSSSTWLSVGGGATCRADLGDLWWKGGKEYYTFLASTSFDAAP